MWMYNHVDVHVDVYVDVHVDVHARGLIQRVMKGFPTPKKVHCF